MITKRLTYYTKKHYVVRDLTDEDLEQFIKGRDYIYFFLHIEELYSILKLNVGEFWKYLLELSEYHRLNFIYEYDEYLEPRLAVNQKLSNILTSFKSYEDLLRNHICIHKDLIGDKKSALNELFSKLYDQSFGYRFMYKLRNYLQHFNLPIYSVAIINEMVDYQNSIGAFTVEPEFDRNELLKYKKWGKVGPEIEKLNDTIPCKPIVENFFVSINVIHKYMRDLFYTKYLEAKDCLLRYQNEADQHYKNQKDDSVSITAYITIFDDEVHIDDIWVPAEIVKRIDKMVAKNKLRTNLNYSFSTMQSFD